MPLLESEWQEFETYDWASDPDFTQGLESVLSSRGNTLSDEEKRTIECKARLFFYSRKIQKNIAYDDYIAWKASHVRSPVNESPSSPLSSASEPVPSTSTPGQPALLSPASVSGGSTSENEKDTAPYPSSFAHIVELITSGKEIPGIKQIPNILLGDTASSHSEIPQRQKPWAK
ncbi:hypothetical protein V1525DRAFT_426223 [Lipomyces kononenkoae]|uniref:Uncharacterized protein n=1 Tax=Lipomyces kononenkoae TaxID=34357 RepID=A0ACC3T0Q2_LIPKO